ncbi:MAG: hypothetical protein EF807_03350 [Candidatus Methanolliviera hydrocarbonicum]|uniref:Uncharacterized protein n=1 Tax=Candidatus Methanolliviera hydrocarbonicum TaxID=2491085 RepID=A0A520KXC5_9EURY|nr:MAG: hypothetical protein EF807_03350 [Candidatus Methanolliviera hydrocarbonicum]
MRKNSIIVSMAIFALVLLAVSIYSYEVTAQPPTYNKITKTGEDASKTILTVEIPKSVAVDERFDVKATVRCEKGKEYTGRITAFIIGESTIGEEESSASKSEAYLDEDVSYTIAEKLEEMNPKEIEEDLEYGELIEVDTNGEERYYIICSLSSKLLRVNDTDQTLDLPLVAPPGPTVCYAFTLLVGEKQTSMPEAYRELMKKYTSPKAESKVSIRSIPVKVT